MKDLGKNRSELRLKFKEEIVGLLRNVPESAENRIQWAETIVHLSELLRLIRTMSDAVVEHLITSDSIIDSVKEIYAAHDMLIVEQLGDNIFLTGDLYVNDTLSVYDKFSEEQLDKILEYRFNNILYSVINRNGVAITERLNWAREIAILSNLAKIKQSMSLAYKKHLLSVADPGGTLLNMWCASSTNKSYYYFVNSLNARQVCFA